MIVLRLRRSKPLYWLSENLNLENQIIDPVVPQNFLVQRGSVNSKTPRILLYDSLDDAIAVYGIGERKLTGKTLGVYRPRYIKDENRYESEPQDCPYRDTLDGHEYWCLLSLMMEKVADIEIGDVIEVRKFRYGRRNQKNSSVLPSPLPRYSWKEILPEWDKKGKTKKL